MSKRKELPTTANEGPDMDALYREWVSRSGKPTISFEKWLKTIKARQQHPFVPRSDKLDKCGWCERQFKEHSK